jgi:D-alanyl-D-alanine carboxypeptidase
MKQRTQLNRLTCLALSLVFLFLSLQVTAFAEEPSPPSMEEATSVWFSHIESDRLICSKEADANVGAGSSVKVMAGLLFCELLQGYLVEEIYITDALLEFVPPMPGRSLHVEAGDVVTVQQLLYAAICGSYNDAFHVLGVLIAGSTQNFINQMNDRAATCGATDTTYAVDISGYRDASVTTAEDTARIALIAAQNELYVKIASASSYRKNGLSIDNRNALISGKETNLYYNAKCRGMSAGYTNRAGNCVVSLYESNGGHYVGVVLGGADGEQEEGGGEHIAKHHHGQV